MTSRSFAATLLCLVALGSPAAFAQEGTTITIGVGTQKVLNIPGTTRVAIADPKILEVKTLGSGSLLLTGMEEGKTSFIVFRGSQRVTYLVIVRKQDPAEVINEIKKLLGDIEGVTIRQVGDRIYLEGQAYTSQDAERIDSVVGLYPNVKSFVKVAPNAKKLVAQNLNANFQRAGLKNVVANVVGSTIFLEGSVESQQDLNKAELITKAMGEKVENLLVVGVKRIIMSEVEFVEIRRDGHDRFGIKYPTDISGSATLISTITGDLFPAQTLAGIGSAVFDAKTGFAIGFQMNDGYGRLLAQPKLLCASGEKAEFLSGGEVPIPLITNNQFTVEYKPYGVILNIRPTADRNGNIQMEIEAEVSEVDLTTAVSIGQNVSVPGFRTRKVKTNITVRHGETIALSGVYSNDQQKSISKIPGLGNIPIIGELFKNRQFDRSVRELVIFVTPRIVNPDSDRVRNYISDIKATYKQAASEVLFNVFD